MVNERLVKVQNYERWLRDNMKHRPRPLNGTIIEPTAKQIRCAELIDYYMGGLHHAPRNVHSCSDSGIEVVFHRGYSFATFDFSEMTRLTLLAHDMRVRVQIHTKGMQLALMLHARDRSGGMASRHPTIESVFAEHRKSFPEGWHDE